MPGFYSPQGLSPTDAKSRVRVLAVGAHPDDLEFMCLEPIARCRAQRNFGGLIVTSGSGSLRAPEHTNLSAAAYAEIRWEEQKKAARLGEYAFVDSLNVESATLRDASGLARLADTFENYFADLSLEALYMHQPFDRHASHVRVCFALLEALRRLPKSKRPAQILGCEVWRNLDWAPKSTKQLRPLSRADLELQVRLAEVFVSQADPKTAKNYVQALVGRKTANAVFQEGLTQDSGVALEVFVDLAPWVDSKLSWRELGDQFLNEFREEALASWPAKT
jgi:LmbE family N-acetylglucosaminyl deacetylase